MLNAMLFVSHADSSFLWQLELTKLGVVALRHAEAMRMRHGSCK